MESLSVRRLDSERVARGLDGRQYSALTVGGETPALIALRLPY